jgi:hypothetical protein
VVSVFDVALPDNGTINGGQSTYRDTRQSSIHPE